MVWRLDEDQQVQIPVPVIPVLPQIKPFKIITNEDINADEVINYGGFINVGSTQNVTITLPDDHTEGDHWYVSNYDKRGHKVLIHCGSADLYFWGLIDAPVTQSNSFTIPFGGWCRIDSLKDRYVVTLSGNLNKNTIYGNEATTTRWCIVGDHQDVANDSKTSIPMTHPVKTTGYNPVTFDKQTNQFMNASDHRINLMITYRIAFSNPSVGFKPKPYKRIWFEHGQDEIGTVTSRIDDTLLTGTTFVRLDAKDNFKLVAYQNSGDMLQVTHDTCVDLTIL